MRSLHPQPFHLMQTLQISLVARASRPLAGASEDAQPTIWGIYFLEIFLSSNWVGFSQAIAPSTSLRSRKLLNSVFTDVVMFLLSLKTMF